MQHRQSICYVVATPRTLCAVLPLYLLCRPACLYWSCRPLFVQCHRSVCHTTLHVSISCTACQSLSWSHHPPVFLLIAPLARSASMVVICPGCRTLSRCILTDPGPFGPLALLLCLCLFYAGNTVVFWHHSHSGSDPVFGALFYVSSIVLLVAVC